MDQVKDSLIMMSVTLSEITEVILIIDAAFEDDALIGEDRSSICITS